jgi:trehalose-6-phosphatase
MAPKLDIDKLQDAYKHSHTRLFFLDYDGTLSPIRTKPEDATPSRGMITVDWRDLCGVFTTLQLFSELIKLLSSLSSDPHNNICIVHILHSITVPAFVTLLFIYSLCMLR